MRFLLIIFCFSVISFSCERKKTSLEVGHEDKVVEAQSVFITPKLYEYSEKLTSFSKENIKEWKEYGDFTVSIEDDFLKTSPSKSLDRANDLFAIVRKLKKTLNIPLLKTQGMTARLNTLYSEVLRLQDMSTITSIKAEEVIVQHQKIITVFSSVNSKINTIYERENFDENVDFDESIFNFNKEDKKIISPLKSQKNRK